MEKEEFVHLKHHWWLSSDFIDESDEERQEEEDSHPLRTGGPHLEGDIPAHLNKMGVRNVPTVLCHGNKPGYCHTGHLEEDTSEVQHELVFEVRSAFRISALSPGRGAHDDAVNLDRVLHRDISCRNTLIYLVNYTTKLGITTYMWTGLLNDLGVSKPIAEPGAAYFACRAGRTGTWQFISARILNNKSRPPMIQESFFYVLVYYGVRYLKHNCRDVGRFVNLFFDSYTFNNGEYTCGQSKLKTMEGGSINTTSDEQLSFTGTPSYPHPLNKLINTMLVVSRSPSCRELSTRTHPCRSRGPLLRQ